MDVIVIIIYITDIAIVMGNVTNAAFATFLLKNIRLSLFLFLIGIKVASLISNVAKANVNIVIKSIAPRKIAVVVILVKDENIMKIKRAILPPIIIPCFLFMSFRLSFLITSLIDCLLVQLTIVKVQIKTATTTIPITIADALIISGIPSLWQRRYEEKYQWLI
ncbi:MAG: hypothetical protein GX995_07275 [Clostridiales bacterium]|nr:hypothetical protein [Clostridiales bacterium]